MRRRVDETAAGKLARKREEEKKKWKNTKGSGSRNGDEARSRRARRARAARASPKTESTRVSPRKPPSRPPSVRRKKSLADALDPEKYELIVRLHPLYKAEGELPQADHVIYEDNISTYDLMACADAVISDYSSLVVEATIAAKPLYLYTYDIDQYSETTGLNMKFGEEAIADYVFRDAGELAAAMEKPYDMEALKAFRDKYIEVEPGHCTEQLADFIQSQIR